MLKKILQIAKDLEGNYQNSTEQFAQMSLKELDKLDIDISLSDFEDEVASWLLENDLPRQLNVYDGFGQPPVTLFNNGKFVVDVYFWRNIDTSIHSHSFEGAFKVLYGRSVHEIFQVSEKQKIANDILLTHVSRERTYLMSAGECSQIKRGITFNHRLIHLDKPTVTLCVRTIDDIDKAQWHHFTNGLSVEKKELEESVLKNLSYFNYLIENNSSAALSFLKNVTDRWSLSTLLNIYEKVSLGLVGLDIEATDSFMEYFLEHYSETQWFKLYVGFFNELEENYYEAPTDGPKDRLIEHAHNFKYTEDETQSLLTQI